MLGFSIKKWMVSELVSNCWNKMESFEKLVSIPFRGFRYNKTYGYKTGFTSYLRKPCILFSERKLGNWFHETWNLFWYNRIGPCIIMSDWMQAMFCVCNQIEDWSLILKNISIFFVFTSAVTSHLSDNNIQYYTPLFRTGLFADTPIPRTILKEWCPHLPDTNLCFYPKPPDKKVVAAHPPWRTLFGTALN